MIFTLFYKSPEEVENLLRRLEEAKGTKYIVGLEMSGEGNEHCQGYVLLFSSPLLWGNLDYVDAPIKGAVSSVLCSGTSTGRTRKRTARPASTSRTRTSTS